MYGPISVSIVIHKLQMHSREALACPSVKDTNMDRGSLRDKYGRRDRRQNARKDRLSQRHESHSPPSASDYLHAFLVHFSPSSRPWVCGTSALCSFQALARLIHSLPFLLPMLLPASGRGCPLEQVEMPASAPDGREGCSTPIPRFAKQPLGCRRSLLGLRPTSPAQFEQQALALAA